MDTKVTAILEGNPYLQITPEIREEVRLNLLEELKGHVKWMTLPGAGEARLIVHTLNQIQEVIEKFREFGWSEVKNLDSTKHSTIVDAIGVCKRGGLRKMAEDLMMRYLAECNFPLDPTPPAEPQ